MTHCGTWYRQTCADVMIVSLSPHRSTRARVAPAPVRSARRCSSRTSSSRTTTACATLMRRSSRAASAARRSRGPTTCADTSACTRPRPTAARTATRDSWTRRVYARTSGGITPTRIRTRISRLSVVSAERRSGSISATRLI